MPVRRVAVAVSGGRDSTALLHGTLRAARPLALEVMALHVHHGLVAGADGWMAQVRAQARRWGAAFEARRLHGEPAPGESVEAWARRERYRALAEMALAAGCGLVLLAHHRRDQAETFLLQALRGGGPAGLASMPALATRENLVWARPWLDRPRESIEAYVQRHRLRFVDDASNADTRFARNRLRGQVWPALSAAFGDAEVALAEAARQAAQAAALAAEVAAVDLPGVSDDGQLLLKPWLALPPARRRNALQAWLAGRLPAPVPQSLVQRLCAELPGGHSGRWPAPQAELRLHRGRLDCVAVAAAGATGHAAVALNLSQPGHTGLAEWGGSFEVSPVAQGGADAMLLAQVLAVPRQGGERFRLAARGLARSLKKQYQAAGVPAWQREGPLLRLPDGRLLFAPGLGVDAALQAPPGQPQLALRWRPGVPGPRQAGD
ncbi:MAG: tRNA lysidine(34) synthetase TilS [Leptothrix sp. (in: Bacteria)]|nr:tRNA lysidine(34) synthetase TilS [Leptothrix sp. (in: b-proteobacteria)]